MVVTVTGVAVLVSAGRAGAGVALDCAAGAGEVAGSAPGATTAGELGATTEGATLARVVVPCAPADTRAGAVGCGVAVATTAVPGEAPAFFGAAADGCADAGAFCAAGAILNPSTSSLNSELLPQPATVSLVVTSTLSAAVVSSVAFVLARTGGVIGGSSKAALFRTTVGLGAGAGTGVVAAAAGCLVPLPGDAVVPVVLLLCCGEVTRPRTPPRLFGLCGAAATLVAAAAAAAAGLAVEVTTGAAAGEAARTVGATVLLTTGLGPRAGRAPLAAASLLAAAGEATVAGTALGALGGTTAGAGRALIPAAVAAAVAGLDPAVLPLAVPAAPRCCGSVRGADGPPTISTSTNSTGARASSRPVPGVDMVAVCCAG
jgi:hypothetical protein